MTSSNGTAPSTLNEQQKAPSKRKDPIHGGIYQSKVLMLFAYRGLRHMYTFRLGTEVDEAKKFDDLVFEYTVGNRKKYRLLQAKHKLDNQGSEKITADSLLTETDGDYSLVKYFFSYREMKGEKLFKGKIHDIIVFTNIDMDLNDLRANNIQVELLEEYDDILSIEDKKKPLRYRFSENVVPILRPKLESYNTTILARRLVKCLLENNPIKHHEPNDIFSHYHLVLAKDVIDVKSKRFRETFLENQYLTGKTEQFRFAFETELARKTDQLAVKNLNKAIDDGQKVSNNKIGLNLSKKFGHIQAQEDWPENAISEEEVRDFFQHLIFAVNQPNEDELGNLIKQELSEEFNIECLDNVYSKFQDRMLDWVQGKKDQKFSSCEEWKQFFDEEKTVRAILFDIRDPVVSFTGRIEQLDSLHNELQKSGRTTVAQAASISGLGGIGKSELVRRYISLHCKEFGRGVVWINAESLHTMSESFKRLAQERLQINLFNFDKTPKSTKSLVEEVYRFFSNGRSLFVFDNADKRRGPDGLNAFLPSLPSKPFVLITSRNCLWGDIQVITLGQWTEDEAAEFIRKALNIENDKQEVSVRRLAETLQYFPLALQQAVACIKVRNAELKNLSNKFDIDDYLRRFDEETEKLLDFEFPEESGDEYTKTTLTTWIITIDKIRESFENGFVAVEIFNRMAFLAADHIPARMFLESVCKTEEVLGSAIQLLKQFSMVSTGHELGLLSVHRLVQLVTRLHLKAKQKEEESLVKACDSARRFYFAYRSTDIQLYSKKQQFVSHLEQILFKLDAWCAKRPEDKIRIEESYIERLLYAMSDAYFDLYDYHRALKLQKRALDIEERHFGPDHFEVAATLDNLGNTFRELGDYNRARESQERALKVKEQYYGVDHCEVAVTLCNLGITFRDLGDYNKAKELQKSALKIEENHYGHDHFEIALTLDNLGNTYKDLGEYNEAKLSQERSLKIKEKHFGSEHSEVAKTLNNFANSLQKLGEYNKAMELQERALKIKEDQFGPHHFEVALTQDNLGNTYRELGDCIKAKKIQELALKTKEQHYGPDHFKVAKTLNNLGNTLRGLGDYKKAKEMQERALKIAKKHYGPDHFEVAFTQDNLGNILRELGEYKEAKHLHEQSLKFKENFYGSDHTEVAKTLNNLGNTMQKLGQYNEARKVQERALKIREVVFSSEHFEVASILDSLGNTLREMGEYNEAKKVQEQALAINEKHYGPEHFQVASVLENLGIVYRLLGDFGKAKELQERALKIQEKQYGPDHFVVARAVNNLGNTLRDLGYPEKAKELHERALTIRQKFYGPHSFQVAASLNDLGMDFQKLGQPNKARASLGLSLEIKEKHYGADHFEVASTLENLGITFQNLHECHQAKDLHERALKIKEAHYGSDNFEVARILNNLGNTWEKMREYNKAKDCLERSLRITEKHFGSQNAEVALVMGNLGITLRELGDYDKAKELQEYALKIEENHFGREHFEVATTLHNLGKTYWKSGDCIKAKEILERALKIKENHFGIDHFDLALTLDVLSHILKDLGDLTGANELEERSSAIREKNSNSEHETST